MFQRRIGSAVAVVALVAAACGPGASSAPTAGGTAAAPTNAASTAAETAAASQGPTVDVIDTIGQGEGELNLIIWPGYAEAGENVAEYDWVHPFEDETGCKVNDRHVAGSSDEMVTLIRQGGQYDGLSASGDATLRLIKDGVVSAVDVEKLFPDWKNVWRPCRDRSTTRRWRPLRRLARLGRQPAHVEHGRGQDRADELVRRLRRRPLTAYKGKVTAYNYAIYIADAALYLKAKPELGITDPYELDPGRSSTPPSTCSRQHAKLIGKYWGTYGETSTTSSRASRPSARRGRTRSACSRPRIPRSTSKPSCPPRVRPAGPTRGCSRRTPSTRTAC